MSLLEIEAVDASEEILLSVFGLAPLEKAGGSVLRPKGFDDVVLKVFRAIKKATAPTEAAGLHDAISLLDRQWGGLSPEKREAAIDAMAAKWLKVSRDTGPIVSSVLKGQGPAIVFASKQATADEHGLAIHPSFDLADEKAVHFLAHSQAHYVTNKLGQRVEEASGIARKIVANGLDAGLDKYDIGKQLASALSEKIDRTDSYWRMLASVYVARARTYSQLKGYAEAGISAYQWESVLDAVTSQHCRFMHGRVFPAAAGLGKIGEVEDSDDPESVKTTLPWMSMGKTAAGDAALFYKQSDGSRRMVCRVAEPGVGDGGIGKYTHALSNQQLLAAGICMPPAHAHCRSVTLPVFGHARGQPYPAEHPAPAPPAPKLAPSQNVPFKPVEPFPNAHLARPLPGGVAEYEPEHFVGPEKPAEKTPKELALEEIDAAQNAGYGNNYGKSPLQPWPTNVYGAKETPFDMPKTIVLTNAAKKPPVSIPVSQIVAPSTNPTFYKPDMKKAVEQDALGPIAYPGQLAKPMVLVKKGPNYYIVEGSEKIMPPYVAQKLAEHAHFNGEKNIAAHVVDADELAAKPPPKPKKPKAAPAPAAPPPAAPAFVPPAPLPTPTAQLDAGTIMGQRVGEAAGSNKGGFYLGTDGVKRYVKFYDDPSQAFGEHLANSIYRDLGLNAPVSHVFEHEGKIAYASDILEGGVELGKSGVTKARAEEFMKGFGADVLTGNWDAVGMGKNNALVLPDGKVARIDQGGTFLFRAKEGRKPASLLNQITETEVFFSHRNPDYAGVAKAAGISSVEDMKEAFAGQMKAIEALKAREGDWASYVFKKYNALPKLAHTTQNAKDAVEVVKMLDARTQLLSEKAAGLMMPPVPVGQVPQYSTTLPHAALKVHDVPETRSLHDIKKECDAAFGKGQLPYTREKHSDYTRKADDEIKNITANARGGIRAFTGSSYGSIRASERSGTPNERSNDIHTAFSVAKPVGGPGRTVFRGIKLTKAEWAKAALDHALSSSEFGLGIGGIPSTTSTSTDINVSARGSFGDGFTPDTSIDLRIYYKLKNKTGISVETISSVGSGEREILSSRETRYRTTGLSFLAGTNRQVLVVEAEEI